MTRGPRQCHPTTADNCAHSTEAHPRGHSSQGSAGTDSRREALLCAPICLQLSGHVFLINEIKLVYGFHAGSMVKGHLVLLVSTQGTRMV